MQIRPILSALTRNKTGVILIAAQIAITLAVVINAMFIVETRIKFISRDSGIDVDNIIHVSSRGLGTEYDQRATMTADLDYLRALPGVIEAAWISRLPLSGGGSANMFQTSMEDDATIEVANYYSVEPATLDALGVKLVSGRNFVPSDILTREQVEAGTEPEAVLVTRAYADKVFPDGDGLGKRLYTGIGESFEIVGLIEHMHGAWVEWDALDQVLLRPAELTGATATYLVRTAPGHRDALIAGIEAHLATSDPTRFIRKVEPFADVVASSYSNDRATAIVLTAVIVMLLIVTSLGIVGLASFSVRQRTKQIGTRRAVGARKIDILRYFLTENWLITTMGVIVGLILTFALNYWLATAYSLDKLDPVYVPLGVLMLWGLGLLSVLGPARRASSVSPAIATRTV